MIAVIDHGLGNLRSVLKAFEHLGYPAHLTRKPEEVESASHIVVPGVGAFKDCIDNLNELELIRPLRRAVERGKPYLGICLGLQILFTEGEEFGVHPGLDLIPGRVVRFTPPPGSGLKVPHMGWNRIQIEKESALLEGVLSGSYVYFVHSYYGVPKDPRVVLTTTEYGVRFASGLAVDALYACQFHPEKSQQIGLQILTNFGKL
ncbi:MAG TPA: imidazole glycerol phosphate synthase subunit HisH [Nitrospiria bacterium]|nr:imidazole glycerol phosphate synthase subunit HisH [Nitrospiria bacterium]